MESLRAEKQRLEDSLLQLDQQYQDEMGKLILIKDDLQAKLKRAEGELEQYRRGVTPVAPAPDHEVDLDDDWGRDWGDGGPSAVGSSAAGDQLQPSNGRLLTASATLDETAHEVLELRASLEEAQRQLEAAQILKVDLEKLRHENSTLKNRMEALDQENEQLEAELDSLRSAESNTGRNEAATVKPAAGEDLSKLTVFEEFCKEVVSVLLGKDDLSEAHLDEARRGLRMLSEKVTQFEKSAENVTANVELLEDQKNEILAEKQALEQELDRLRGAAADLKTVEAQLKKATLDREAMAAKLEKAKKHEALLQDRLAEMDSATVASSDQDEALKQADQRLVEMQTKLVAQQTAVHDLQTKLEAASETHEHALAALKADVFAKTEEIADLTRALTEARSQAEAANSRQASVLQELQNVQMLLGELQNASGNEREEAASLLKKTREQDSELQQLRGELQLLRMEESQKVSRVEELEEQLQSLQLTASSGDQATAEEMAKLRQLLEVSDQELELLRHSRDSVANELEVAKLELDNCQQRLLQLEQQEGSASAMANQVHAAKQAEAAAQLAAAQKEIEALQVVRQALERGMQQLTSEKEQMVAVVSDKARENADLKARLDGLMGALANEKQLVGQLQQQLQQVHGEVTRMQQLQTQADQQPDAMLPFKERVGFCLLC